MTEKAPLDKRALLKDALRAVSDMQDQLAAAERVRTEPIAIVGIGCRFPGGVDSCEAFWALLSGRVDAIREVPPSRWTREDYLALHPEAAASPAIQYGGFVDGIDQFDPHFFGIAPREAVSMDPQHRLVLEVCWQALERGGQAADRLRGSLTGVFVGITSSDYATHLRVSDPLRLDVYSANGNVHNSAAGRVSYLLGLHGPSMAIDTACSASLAAVHLACQSLRLGESDMALAGGVNSILVPDAFVSFDKGGMMAADGRCKTFDEAADGFVRGEGCGMLVLKRVSDAIADGDTILALIRGSAVNQDGPSSGLTVPNGPAQQAVLRRALAVARVRPADVSFVEAHGTGTFLGDPIELEALDAVMSEGRSPDASLVVGSVKTNLGHLEAASGVAGLIKVVLALMHESIPANLHFHRLNPAITLRRLAVTVPTEAVPWRAGASPRIAGVSSFGFSGTNAHVVVEEAPAAPAREPEAAPAHLVTISGKTAAAVSTLARLWGHDLAAAPRVELADVARSSTRGRSHFSHRAALVASSAAQLHDQLAALADGRRCPGLVRGDRTGADRPSVAFLFTGQGSQYAGMARELYRIQPVFREALNRCDRLLRPHLERPLLSVMDASGDATIDQTAYAQPALFAIEYALAEMWRSWGVEPDAVLGHSVGEYVAACVAGVFELEDALALVATRGRLMQALPAGGTMAAVLCGEPQVRAALRGLGDQVSIAAVNGPANVVISGVAAAVQAVVALLEQEQVSSRALTVSHAFHSPLMEPMLREFKQAVEAVRSQAPRIALISNVTGRAMEQDAAPSAEYWCRHIREAVRFADGVETLHELGHRVFLECGPAPTLIGMGRRVVAGQDTTWLASLRRERGDWQEVLTTLGTLYTLGAEIAWLEVHRGIGGRQIALPTYPFERERYWVDAPRPGRSTVPALRQRSSAPVHPLLGLPVRAAIKETIFENEVSSESPAFLGDHVIHGEPAFPATAYIEMILAAAARLPRHPSAVLNDFVISQALLLAAGERVVLQTVATPETGGDTVIAVLSRPALLGAPGDRWTTHASARVSAALPADPPEQRDSLDTLQSRCDHPVSVEQLYLEHTARGLAYGPAFRGLAQIWLGEREALGLLEWPAVVRAEIGDYLLHPALLDACLQLLGAAVPRDGNAITDVYLPVSIDRIERVSDGRPVWGHVKVQQTSSPQPDELAADVTLFDEAGQQVGALAGLRLRRATSETLRRATMRSFDDWLYEVRWREDESEVPGAPDAPADGTWVVLADRGGEGARLAEQISRAGGEVVLVAADEQFEPGTAAADPLAWVDALRQRVSSDARAPLRGWVHLRSLDAGLSSEDDAPASEDLQTGTGLLLRLVQGLLRAGVESTRVWIVTRGCQATAPAMPVNAVQAPVWALARTISAEHPQMACTCVDLATASAADESAQLWRIIARPTVERHFALRSGRRYVARLVRSPRPRTQAEPSNVALETSARGVLDNLRLDPAARRQPGPGEVEIQVTHAGLNFRDVLNALGMYPGEAGPLGAECVGTVARVGPGVSHLAVGDDVFGMAGGSLRSYVTTAAGRIIRKPATVGSDEAATIPLAFLTAEYALNRLAALQPGERVLIHSATGGVGLAAVQIARRAGAEIFATAGSPEKRAVLRGMGIEHVFDSRSLEFSREILACTGGEGVHVALNALAGEFIGKTVEALTRGGRFVEIGKTGIWSGQQMRALRPDVRYFPFDLGDLDAGAIGEMLETLVIDFAAGRLTPLPRREYPIADAASAFRFMAQARHVGKIVLTIRGQDEARIRPDATYMITGGFSGLGLAVAGWLKDQGARRLALIGRTGADRPAAAAAVAQLEAGGVEVLALRADVADPDDIDRVFEALRDGPQLRGIVHAAGVLDDGTIEQLTWEQFEHVFGPKVYGAWRLHQRSRTRPLDFFALFSSSSALIGTPGQGNYASANAFLDALAHHRHASGLPAASINWGPWEEVGMAAGLTRQNQQRWDRLGLGAIDSRRGLAIFEQALTAGLPQLAVLPVDWDKLSASAPAGLTSPLFAELIAEGPGSDRATSSRPALIARLEQVPEKGRTAAIQAHVRDAVRHVLGVDPSFPLELSHGLRSLGMDSLMAVELRNHLQASTGRALPSTLAFDRPTIAALAAYLEPLITAAAAPETVTPVAAPVPVLVAAHADLDELSDEDAELLLARELER